MGARRPGTGPVVDEGDHVALAGLDGTNPGAHEPQRLGRLGRLFVAEVGIAGAVSRAEHHDLVEPAAVASHEPGWSAATVRGSWTSGKRFGNERRRQSSAEGTAAVAGGVSRSLPGQNGQRSPVWSPERCARSLATITHPSRNGSWRTSCTADPSKEPGGIARELCRAGGRAEVEQPTVELDLAGLAAGLDTNAAHGVDGWRYDGDGQREVGRHEPAEGERGDLLGCQLRSDEGPTSGGWARTSRSGSARSNGRRGHPPGSAGPGSAGRG